MKRFLLLLFLALGTIAGAPAQPKPKADDPVD